MTNLEARTTRNQTPRVNAPNVNTAGLNTAALNTIPDAYREDEILNADPVKLVQMLYGGALDATGAARQHLASGAIRQRSRQIMKAWEILYELTATLDRQKGGEIGESLAGLYAYMQARLLEANAQQADAPLAEVESLLSTLGDAWQGVKPPPAPDSGAYQPVNCTY
jgi:flagellar protein FliS